VKNALDGTMLSTSDEESICELQSTQRGFYKVPSPDHAIEHTVVYTTQTVKIVLPVYFLAKFETSSVYAKTFFRPQDNLTYNSRFLPVMANFNLSHH